MNHDDKKRIVDFYENALAQYGNDARSVHWADTHSQEIRFEILNKIAPLENKCVLDVGCGLGDLYKFFAAKKIAADYSGIDIVPAFIEKARMRFPGASFLCGDAETVQKNYDYIFASGVLSFAVSGGKEHYFEMIKLLFEHAKEGLAFNMLKAGEHVSNDTFITYDPQEVVNYCKTLSPHVELVEGYLPWDFTIYMYKK